MNNQNQLTIQEPPSLYPVGEVDLSILQSEQSAFDQFPIMKQFFQQKLDQQLNKMDVLQSLEGNETIEQQQQMIYPKPHEFIKIPYDKMKFIQQPIQRDGILQCQVRKINSNTPKTNLKYELLIFDYPILIAEKIHTLFKRKFIIRLVESNLLAGKVKWDKQGLNFLFIDNKFHPKKCSSVNLHRNCLGGANYTKQGKKKPHKIQVFLPEVKENNEIQEHKLKEVHFFEELPQGFIEFKNREPVFTKETNTYTLFYYNRALLASSKNFQLCQQNKSQIQLLFGKVEKGLYNLDFSWPISPLQAFQIALSCYISKARD